MSRSLNNAESHARRAEHHARDEDYDDAIVELSKAVKELIADNKRLEREVENAKPRSGRPIY